VREFEADGGRKALDLEITGSSQSPIVRARGAGSTPPLAVSSFGGFRTPAAGVAARSGAAGIRKPSHHPTLAARVSTSRSCRFCCKSQKAPGDKFPARRRNKPGSPIDVASGSLPKSPVGLSPGNEVPHMFTRKPRLQPEKFAIIGSKRLLQQNLPTPDSCTAANTPLFDHFIGDAEQRGRRGEAGHPTILDRQNWFHSAFCVAGATAATGSRARAQMQTRQSPKPMRSERSVTSPRGGNCAPSCGQPDPPAVGLASNIAKPPF
jgi:hypothetical protein